ncbi:YdcF family protein [Thermobifida alba]|uniref:YdcF family protein n=2 Tax=Thermobifida alba TaxID=53522 RepID=A0ABY4L6S5_THEAE|nr:YdcF family protein [Thermobifida alba]
MATVGGEVIHSVFPWTEWHNCPGYVITTALNLGSIALDVAAVVGGAALSATGYGAVLGVPLAAWHGASLLNRLGKFGSLLPDAPSSRTDVNPSLGEGLDLPNGRFNLPDGRSPADITTDRGEAVHYREHVLDLGVSDEAVLVEPRAANTGQNITFSRQVLAEAGLAPATVMLVTMPYMQRRAYATTRRLWPEVEAVCASEPVGFRDYLAGIGDDRLVIDTMVGDLQRVIEYPDRGFAVEQHVPDDVHAAYQALVDAGFTSRLIGA